MNDLTKNILLWVIIAVVLLTVFSNFSPRTGESREMGYSTFLQEVKSKNVDNAVIKGEIIEGTKRDGTQFRVYNPETDNNALIGLLDREGVNFKGAPPDKPNFLLQLFLSSFPVLLLVAIFIYFMKMTNWWHANSSQRKARSSRRSCASARRWSSANATKPRR